MSNARKPAAKVVLGLMAVVAVLFILPSASAAASVPAKATVTAVHPMSAPAGCVSGNFCVYRDTNGGDLCLTTPGALKDWGGCANHDQSLYNNGTPVAFDAVDIFWGHGYAGAYYCLPRGGYLLFANENRFDHPGAIAGDGGTANSGLGDKVGNNAASHHWAQFC
jgi:hypothetical protein